MLGPALGQVKPASSLADYTERWGEEFIVPEAFAELLPGRVLTLSFLWLGSCLSVA